MLNELEQLVREVVAEYTAIKEIVIVRRRNLKLEVSLYFHNEQNQSEPLPPLMLDGYDYVFDPTHNLSRNTIREHIDKWLAAL
jgi:hypothetical protein